METTVVTPWVRTYMNKRVNPLALTVDDIDVRDLAHHLALINRFVGATRRPVDVALHSVYVSRIAERLAPSERRVATALQGLLHDGSEYILGEVTKWLKRTPDMIGYRQAEERAQTVVYQWAGVPLEQFAEVTAADDLMVRVEAEDSWGAHWSHVRGYHPLTQAERDLIGPWRVSPWMESEAAFLGRYTELTGIPVEPKTWS